MKRTEHRLADPIPADSAVDLHLHTTASDGYWIPEELITYLADRDYRVAAICDHDTQRSVAAAIAAGESSGVHVIPGVEVTCRWNDRQLHVLVYGIDPRRTDVDAQPFFARMERIDRELQRNAADARDRFEAAGKALPSLESIRNGRPLWPFHVLSAYIEEKHAPNLKESAEALTKLGGMFTADLPLGEVIYSAHRAGGLCVLAHPGRADAVGVVTEIDLDAILADYPLDGLEAHYRSYTDAQTADYRKIALDRRMLVSCGSDSHGPGRPVDPRAWKADWCSGLLERLGVQVADASPPDRAWELGMDPNAAPPPSPDNGASIEDSTGVHKPESAVAR